MQQDPQLQNFRLDGPLIQWKGSTSTDQRSLADSSFESFGEPFNSDFTATPRPTMRMGGGVPIEISTIQTKRLPVPAQCMQDTYASYEQSDGLFPVGMYPPPVKSPEMVDRNPGFVGTAGNQPKPPTETTIPRLPRRQSRSTKKTSLTSVMGRFFESPDRDKPKILLCLVYGLPGYSYEEEPFVGVSRMTELKPKKQDLLREAQRRYQIHGMKAMKEIKPTSVWSLNQLKNWLRLHPISNEELSHLQRFFDYVKRSVESSSYPLLPPYDHYAPDPRNDGPTKEVPIPDDMDDGEDLEISQNLDSLDQAEILTNPARTVKACLRTLKTHGHSSVRLTCLKTLIRIAKLPGTLVYFAEVIQVVVDVMQKSTSDPYVTAKCCEVLALLASHDAGYRVKIGEVGGIGFVVDAIKYFQNNYFVLVRACHAFSTLAHLCLANCKLLYDDDGVVITIDMMRKHSQHDTTLMWGCRMLKELAFDSDVLKHIREYGGVKVVVEAMSRPGVNVDVQRWGCYALADLAMFDKISRDQIARLNGIEVILSAIGKDSKDPEVQGFGFRLLRELATNNQLAKLIGQQGGIQMILDAMGNHRENASLQEWACRALGQLSCFDGNSAMMVDLDDVRPLLTHARKFFKQDGEVDLVVRNLLYLMEMAESRQRAKQRPNKNKNKNNNNKTNAIGSNRSSNSNNDNNGVMQVTRIPANGNEIESSFV
uniref:LRRK2 ARM repeat domain-containing protein n=1 Tax=Cyclophora tenuis TaxID=216820 RepID=A0A7S1D9C4_CYCTE